MLELVRNHKMCRDFYISYTPVAAACLWYWKLIGHTKDSLIACDMSVCTTLKITFLSLKTEKRFHPLRSMLPFCGLFVLMLQSSKSKSKSFFKLKIKSNRNRIFRASRQTICPLKRWIAYWRRRASTLQPTDHTLQRGRLSVFKLFICRPPLSWSEREVRGRTEAHAQADNYRIITGHWPGSEGWLQVLTAYISHNKLFVLYLFKYM